MIPQTPHQNNFVEDSVLYLFFNDAGIQKGGGVIKAPMRVIESKTLIDKIQTLIGRDVTIDHNDYSIIGRVIDAGFHKDIITPSGKEIKANGLFFAKIRLNDDIPKDIVLDRFGGVSSEISGNFVSEIINQYNGVDGTFEKILDFKEFVGITLTNIPRSSETRILNNLDDNFIMNEDFKKEITDVIKNSMTSSKDELFNMLKNEYKTQEDKDKEIANMMESVKSIDNKIKNMQESSDKIENMQKIINELQEDMKEVKNMCGKVKNETTCITEDEEDVKNESEDKKDDKNIDNKIKNSLDEINLNF